MCKILSNILYVVDLDSKCPAAVNLVPNHINTCIFPLLLIFFVIFIYRKSHIDKLWTHAEDFKWWWLRPKLQAHAIDNFLYSTRMFIEYFVSKQLDFSQMQTLNFDIHERFGEQDVDAISWWCGKWQFPWQVIWLAHVFSNNVATLVGWISPC